MVVAQVLGEAGAVGVDAFVKGGVGRRALRQAGERGWRSSVEIGVGEFVKAGG